MSDVIKCPHLNDRVVDGDTLASHCLAKTHEECPKIRSMKRAVNHQCWKCKKQ